jgi:L1 cell adhesion molecule
MCDGLIQFHWNITLPVIADCDVLQDDCFDSGAVTGNSREAQVGGLKLDLPLDEDDYLMPSAQQNQNSTTYMDLIGDSKLPGQFINVSNN